MCRFGISPLRLFGRRTSIWMLYFAFVAILCAILPTKLHADAASDAQKAERERMYRTFKQEIKPDDIGETIQTLGSMQSRVAGYPDDAKAADYVEQQFTKLGLSTVSHEDFDVTVPYDKGVDDPAQGAYATIKANGTPDIPVTGYHQRMYPLWPNLVRTPTLPADGITAPLIYVKDGKLRNFNGKTIDGAVVLVDFNCAAEWLNAPRLGARAVIFVAPSTTMRGEAEAKFISIPIAIPRFYMKREDAAPLLALCTGTGTPPTVTLTCNMPWVTHKSRNITGFIQGTDPALRDQVIVTQAYYDSISVVPALAPGAETACGMAAMLEQIRIFKAHPPKRTMMFVATSAHFQALQGVREYVDKHIDDWTQPSIVETASSKQFSHSTAIWLAIILLAVIFVTWRTSRNKPAEGGRKYGSGTIIGAVTVILLALLNVGFHLQSHEKDLRKPPTIYLWCGLDMSSQSQSFGVFYKGWFYDFREDIQGKFSDIARVCRENAEKVGNTFGINSKRYFNDGVNPVDGKNWRNFIPGKPAFDSEAVTMAGGEGITFATTDDSRSLVDTPFDTVDRVNTANVTQQVQLLSCLMWHIVTDSNAPGDVNAQRMPITDPSKWSRMALQGGFATLQGIRMPLNIIAADIGP